MRFLLQMIMLVRLSKFYSGILRIHWVYNLQDLDYGSCYTFKEYSSRKVIAEEGWKHEKIILKSKSFETSFQDIIIEPESINEKIFKVIGIFDRVIE